jgi:predicted negative regulator of RcsB-dependent stress response
MLGDLLAAAGDRPGAIAAYEAAIDSKHAYWSWQARIDLACLLDDDGDERDNARARELLEIVAASGDADFAPIGSLVLGQVIADSDASGAVAAFETAIATGEPEVSPHARLFLALLRWGSGDTAGARELLEAAAASIRPEDRASVYGVLGDLLNNMGDGDAAQAAYRTACASGDPNVAGAAERRVSEPPPVLDFAAAIERARSTFLA